MAKATGERACGIADIFLQTEKAIDRMAAKHANYARRVRFRAHSKTDAMKATKSEQTDARSRFRGTDDELLEVFQRYFTKWIGCRYPEKHERGQDKKAICENAPFLRDLVKLQSNLSFLDNQLERVFTDISESLNKNGELLLGLSKKESKANVRA